MKLKYVCVCLSGISSFSCVLEPKYAKEVHKAAIQVQLEMDLTYRIFRNSGTRKNSGTRRNSGTGYGGFEIIVALCHYF